ncbi:MAG TPA: CBS domain-containing protein, partial [Oceanobacillus sp.]|nr:CBS domain-containing protein [Oceanobacillus sp.]
AGVIDSSVPTFSPETPIESLMSVFSTTSVALVTERIPGSEDRQVVGIVTKIDLLDFLTNR